MKTKQFNVIADGLVDDVTLYCRRFMLFRLDVLPFLIGYSFLFGSYGLKYAPFDGFLFFIAVPVLLLLHLLLFLLSQSSVRLKSLVGNYPVSSIEYADFVHVKAAPNAGLDRLVQLSRSSTQNTDSCAIKINDTLFQQPTVYFSFQKVIYSFSNSENKFVRQRYPVSAPLSSFLANSGYKACSAVDAAVQVWGLNEFDIPIPNFVDLYAVREYFLLS